MSCELWPACKMFPETHAFYPLRYQISEQDEPVLPSGRAGRPPHVRDSLLYLPPDQDRPYKWNLQRKINIVLRLKLPADKRFVVP